MVCAICHSHCESDNEQTFRIVICDDYEALANIPCTARNRFNQMSRLNFKANGRRYVVNVYRGHEATLIGGDDWTKFKRDFNVGQGNVVVFHMTGRTTKLMKRKRFSMMITGLKMH
uniref:TF-B3 domain-containing protein n=1 Tax=Triticum aestivum TaxID=4565 RepID=A0A3B6IWP3_WHEAT